jgi:hypothetical protein
MCQVNFVEFEESHIEIWDRRGISRENETKMTFFGFPVSYDPPEVEIAITVDKSNRIGMPRFNRNLFLVLHKQRE